MRLEPIRWRGIGLGAWHHYDDENVTIEVAEPRVEYKVTVQPVVRHHVTVEVVEDVHHDPVELPAGRTEAGDWWDPREVVRAAFGRTERKAIER